MKATHVDLFHEDGTKLTQGTLCDNGIVGGMTLSAVCEVGPTPEQVIDQFNELFENSDPDFEKINDVNDLCTNAGPDSCTALEHAVISGEIEMMQLLIAVKANVQTADEWSGWTALHV